MAAGWEIPGVALGTPEFNSSVTPVNSKLVSLFLLVILTLVGHNENYWFTNNCVTPIYKTSEIVQALWLAERRVCMRVRKHGCDVKMFCFSRALPLRGVITRLIWRKFTTYLFRLESSLAPSLISQPFSITSAKPSSTSCSLLVCIAVKQTQKIQQVIEKLQTTVGHRTKGV